MSIDIIISSATHRMGSTLLQRIFNSRKKTLIWGEHGGIVSDFIRIYDVLEHFSKFSEEEKQNFFGGGKDPNCWIANMTPDIDFVEDAIVCSLHSFFEKLYSQYRTNHDMIGFKEVRYGERELLLLRKCYPEANIVLLVRKPLDTWQSILDCGGMNWYSSVQDFAEKWKERVAFYRKMAEEDNNSYIVYYEDLTERKKETVDLILELAKITRSKLDHVLDCVIEGVETRRVVIPAEDVNLLLRLEG